ncbi:tektin-4 [Lampris incognitus]|uniref:tektin-4 n=1 Tax=Lampris incognitus TaxID=2546036 RepID=UPI0024B600AE|nr:tektin-4 [Lampris incognitus]
MNTDRATREPTSLRETPLQPSSGMATAGYRSGKYTPTEWRSNNHAILQQAATDRYEARGIQQTSKTIYQDTEAVVQRIQAGATRNLGERLQEIHIWKSELQLHIGRLLSETDLLVLLKRRLEKALDATELPYAIATDNLTCRERRRGPDLVRDTVEEELLTEVDLIRSIQALLKRTADQVVNQIKINRETKLMLELDWSDKCKAYNLDDQSGRYNNMSMDTEHHHSSAAMQEHVCDPTSWIKFTQDNLSKASQEEQATKDLRALAERVLQEIAEDLRGQCSTVDEAFNQRCMEVAEAKTQLELHLTQILEQIGDQERNIVALEQAIHDKEAPLRVAQSRLYLRSLRPNMELCRDDPQFSLEGEVGQIDASLVSLHQQLSEARGSLSHLKESRMALVKDIMCKSNSLLIDRDKCMVHRRHYPTLVTLSGH